MILYLCIRIGITAYDIIQVQSTRHSLLYTIDTTTGHTVYTVPIYIINILLYTHLMYSGQKKIVIRNEILANSFPE